MKRFLLMIVLAVMAAGLISCGKILTMPMREEKRGLPSGTLQSIYADNTVLIFMQFPTPGKRWRESSSLIQVIIGCVFC